MTHHTTIKIEITAFDERATATYRVHATSDDGPASCLWQLARMLDRFEWRGSGIDVHARDTAERTEEPASYRERLAAAGLDPCELDVDESEAPPPNASPDLDTDTAAAHVVIEWAGVCTDPTKLRRTIDREQARAAATPRKAVRSSVIAACERRLRELEGEGVS